MTLTEMPGGGVDDAATVSHRKDDHVRLAIAQHHERLGNQGHNQFDDVAFVHHALCGVDTARVSTATIVGGMRWPVPLYINAMTGGSPRTGDINRGLAIAARETGLPVASGSMSAFLKNPAVADTYRVLRREHPDGLVFANVNANATPAMARRAVDLVAADALQVHVNAAQETVMPEGDRDFSRWPDNIARLVEDLDIPVVVKEVGFGLSRDTVEQLAGLGVRIADVSGSGGTNFAIIENGRRARADYGYLAGWGQSAVASLLDASCRRDDGAMTLLASGGVRTPLDVIRALALGARAVGVSGHFLAILQDDGIDALVQTIAGWLDQLRQLMALLGASTVDDLAYTDVLITGELAEYCALRGISCAGYAHRRTAMRPRSR
jgi:isopentenyl-diphosphate delta-isomerase